MSSTPFPLPAPFAQKIARILAARHARPADREDFAADLVAEVIARWARFDPARGNPEAYVEVICRTKAAKLVRDARARKRSAGSPTVPLHGVDAAAAPQPFEAWEIRDDVAAVLRALPPDLRAACEAVLRADTVSMAARGMDEPRSTLVSKLAQLRPYFERAGLRDYLVK